MTLPDFLVIGAYKSGTTALHHSLRAHPQLYVPARKEPNFFAFLGDERKSARPIASTSIRDRAAYEALFAPRGDALAAGEVSPEYLANPRACENIRALLPNARLVAVLRNPVERAYSDYLMYRRDGIETEADFARALLAQEERAQKGKPTGFYISTGRYGEQLDRYSSAFPPEQLLVLLHDDLRERPDEVFATIFRFLGVDPDVVVDDRAPANVSGVPGGAALKAAMLARRRLAKVLRPVVPERLKRTADAALQRRLKRPPMPQSARQLLIDVYRDDITRLEGLLDRDLSAWLRT